MTAVLDDTTIDTPKDPSPEPVVGAEAPGAAMPDAALPDAAAPAPPADGAAADAAPGAATTPADIASADVPPAGATPADPPIADGAPPADRSAADTPAEDAPAEGAPAAKVAEPAASFTLTREVVIKSLPQSTTAESIHALRTHVVARHIQEGLRGVAVCETEQAGGSFLAVNLAISLAEAGIRTLLIDTRLRDPDLAKFIAPSRDLPGLADVLEQADLPIARALQSVLPDLSLMYAGTARENTLDLLGGARFAAVVDICMREFDFTIATTAPANRFADGRRVASVLHNAIVVARKDVTFTADVETLVGELDGDQVTVIGTVFNDF